MVDEAVTNDRAVKEAELDAWRAWIHLYRSLMYEKKLPSLEWTLRWMPDGTLDRLWRSSPIVVVDILAARLFDTSWYRQHRDWYRQHRYWYWPAPRHKRANRMRAAWNAPPIELLEARLPDLEKSIFIRGRPT